MEKTLSEAAEAARTDPASDLSVTEHAAFREIARALGARYAGDEAAPEADPAEPALPRAAGGAVMPFPGTRMGPAEAGVDPAAILEGLPAAILIHRGDGILAANRRLLDLTGFSDLAALAQAGIDRLFPRLPPGRPDEPAIDAPVLLKTADGRSRPVAVRRGRLPWQGAPATSLLLHEASEDDPARERAAERIARSFRDAHAAEAAGTLDALEDGIVTIDGAGRVLALNRSAAALFACAPREVVGNAFAGLFEAQTGEALRTALRVPGSDPVPVSVRGAALTLRIAQAGSEGRRVAVLRATEPAPPARDRSASFARFAGEIRPPVTGIVGLAEAMEAERLGPLGDGRQRGCLHEIRASGEHVLGLLSDLVDLAAIEAGGLAMTVGPLALNDLVAGCVERLQAQAASGHIVLRTSFSPDLALLEADEPSLSRAASTVIANAIRLTGAGGQVIVSTMPAERGAVALRVRDTGAGMSADEVAAALEPFRDGAASGQRTDGRGLGLPLTRALVEANHGQLLISSRKDEGTLVEILLPGRRAMSA
ncbi:Cell-division control histidine kinase PdhS [Methylobacterium trifolii]|uniref:histidine kinase n=1 Tax=Methylobacterium trifolii TaxID=1003092 RepID=A0ABQ4U217_9HYPH|nr:Cell-division control histidine kinase PdhS [Methylobacterium trifolii]